jgi:gas vesicle protein
MIRRGKGREVVFVERAGDASAKWLFWGAVLGAGLALLYAPRSGEETRRALQRKLWKLRAMTEEKLDEIAHQFGSDAEAREELADDDDDFEDAGEPSALRSRTSGATARDELERRLAEARARRRAVGDYEEPLA